MEFKKKTKDGNVRVDLTPVELCYLLVIVGMTNDTFDEEVYPSHIKEMDGWDLFKKMDNIVVKDDDIKKYKQPVTGHLKFKKWGE